MIKELTISITADDTIIDTRIFNESGYLTPQEVQSLFRYAEYFITDKAGDNSNVDLTTKHPVSSEFEDTTDEITRKRQKGE